MIYKIICAGNNTFKKCYQFEDNEYLIAVDGGYDVIKKMNLVPKIIIGDFDSLKNRAGKEKNNDFPYIKLPTRKDESDFEFTIKYLISEIKIKKTDLIKVYNGTGKRLDHYQAILNTLIKYHDYQIIIIDSNNKIYLQEKNFVIEKSKYHYVSFFAIEDKTIISLKNFSFPLQNYCLNKLDNLCLSNEVKDLGIVEVNKKIIVMETK